MPLLLLPAAATSAAAAAAAAAAGGGGCMCNWVQWVSSAGAHSAMPTVAMNAVVQALCSQSACCCFTLLLCSVLPLLDAAHLATRSLVIKKLFKARRRGVLHLPAGCLAWRCGLPAGCRERLLAPPLRILLAGNHRPRDRPLCGTPSYIATTQPHAHPSGASQCACIRWQPAACQAQVPSPRLR